MALELGIFGCHIVWRLLHRDLLKEAKATRVTVDELLEAKRARTIEREGTRDAADFGKGTGSEDLEAKKGSF